MCWPLPNESATRAWLFARQRPDGVFLHTQGSLAQDLAPDAPWHRLTNAHQALMALQTLGAQPRHDPLPAFGQAVKDYVAHQQAEHEPISLTVASSAVHVHLLCGRPVPPEVERIIRPLVEPRPLPQQFAGVELVSEPVRYYRLQRQPVPQAEAYFAYLLRGVGRWGTVYAETWSYQSDDRGRSAALLAGACSAVQLAPGAAVTRRLLDELAAFIFERGHESEHFPYGRGRQRQLYCTLACLLLIGAIQPAGSLPCDAHLFGLGEHMQTP
jgi:hypothetical protein